MGNELTGQITANSAAATAAVGGAVASSRAARNVAINLDVTHTGDINNVADVEELGAGHYAAAERAMGSRGYSLNRAWSPA
jgi:hypothetical protein